MASYFVACDAPPDGVHAVHDRTLCPPSCFPCSGATEYLGEFDEVAQAMAVARLRYAPVGGCSCCAPAPARLPMHSRDLTPSRP